MNPILATVLTFAAALAFLRIMDFFAHRGWIESRLSRKLIHIGTGPIFVLCWLFFPDVPISSKPLEVRMGKGKGNVDYWCSKVQPGTVLYEMEGVSEDLAREAFRLAANKLPIKTTFVTRAVM